MVLEYSGDKNIELKSNITVRPVTAVASMHLPVILKFNDKYLLFFYIAHTAEKKDYLFKLLNASLCCSSDELHFSVLSIKSLICFHMQLH